MLRVVAERISSTLRVTDTLARISGDEFVAIVDGVAPEAAALIAEKVRSAVRQPLVGGQDEPRLKISVGVSLYPLHARDVDGLLRIADEAMYGAKRAGKKVVTQFQRPGR